MSAERRILVLAIRSRIEELQNKLLWPKNVKKPNSRRKIFRIILNSQDEEFAKNENVIGFRELFLASNVPEKLFLDTLVNIYDNFLENASHNVRFSKIVSHKDIEVMLMELGIIPDESKVRCVEIIVKPIPLRV